MSQPGASGPHACNHKAPMMACTPPATASYVMSIAGWEPAGLQAFKATSARGKWCHVQSGHQFWACVHLLSPLSTDLPRHSQALARKTIAVVSTTSPGMTLLIASPLANHRKQGVFDEHGAHGFCRVLQGLDMQPCLYNIALITLR